MQLVLVSDVIAPGLCPAINTAYRLGWHTHVINFRGANASELRDGKLGRNGKPEHIGAALDAPGGLADAIGEDVILLLDAFDAYLQLGPRRALEAYCAIQRAARQRRPNVTGERLVVSTEAVLFPFKADVVADAPKRKAAPPYSISQGWEARFPLRLGELFTAANIGGLAGDAAALRAWRDMHVELRTGGGSGAAASARAGAQTTNDQGVFLILMIESAAFRDLVTRDTRAELFLSVPRTAEAARKRAGGPLRQLANGTVVLGAIGAAARAPAVLHWPGPSKSPNNFEQETDYAGALACGPVWRAHEHGRRSVFSDVSASALGKRVTAWRARAPRERDDGELVRGLLQARSKRCFIPDSKKCKVQSKQGNLRSATFGTEVTCVRWAFQLPKRAEDCRAARA